MSLYQGDFETIGHEIAARTNGFEDFTLLMNVPYGIQSARAQRQSNRDTQNIYRRLGRFLSQYLKTEDEAKTEVDERKRSPLPMLESDDLVVAEQQKNRITSNKNLEHVYVLAKSHHYGHELSF